MVQCQKRAEGTLEHANLMSKSQTMPCPIYTQNNGMLRASYGNGRIESMTCERRTPCLVCTHPVGGNEPERIIEQR